VEGVTGNRHLYSDMGGQVHGTVRHDVFIDPQDERDPPLTPTLPLVHAIYTQ
jgi:hypothetical protein